MAGNNDSREDTAVRNLRRLTNNIKSRVIRRFWRIKVTYLMEK